MKNLLPFVLVLLFPIILFYLLCSCKSSYVFASFNANPFCCSMKNLPFDCYAIKYSSFSPPLSLLNRVGTALSPIVPFRVVGSNGLGPSTSRLSGVCSNQLSYEPINGGGNRVRTDDPLLAGQVLYQLSYTPIKQTPSFFSKESISLLKTE